MKPNLKELVEKARAAGACRQDLERVEKYATWIVKDPEWAYWYASNVKGEEI